MSADVEARAAVVRIDADDSTTGSAQYLHLVDGHVGWTTDAAQATRLTPDMAAEWAERLCSGNGGRAWCAVSAAAVAAGYEVRGFAPMGHGYRLVHHGRDLGVYPSREAAWAAAPRID